MSQIFQSRNIMVIYFSNILKTSSVKHLQYTSWPDHGVPNKPEHFLHFIELLRREMPHAEPILVHCSAGVGRTGVTIALDAAISSIEQKIPIEPLVRSWFRIFKNLID